MLLAPRVTPDSVAIWKAGIDRGWRVERLGSWRLPEELKPWPGDVLMYAEPLFAEAVADQMDCILIEPPPEWLVVLPECYRKRRVTLRKLQDLHSEWGVPLFVKPAEGKVFEPRVYDSALDLPTLEMVDGTLPVLCSEPVTWDLEVRCFVRDRQLMDISPYWRNGTLAQSCEGDWPFAEGEESAARAFVLGLLEDPLVSLPPALVVDIGITREHGWAVVEANPCWGAGLYGCAAETVLETIAGAVKRRGDMTDLLWKWTSPRVERYK